MNTARTSTEAPRCVLCGCSLDPKRQFHVGLNALDVCEECFQRYLRAMGKGKP